MNEDDYNNNTILIASALNLNKARIRIIIATRVSKKFGLGKPTIKPDQLLTRKRKVGR